METRRDEERKCCLDVIDDLERNITVKCEIQLSIEIDRLRDERKVQKTDPTIVSLAVSVIVKGREVGWHGGEIG